MTKNIWGGGLLKDLLKAIEQIQVHTLDGWVGKAWLEDCPKSCKVDEQKMDGK